MMEADQELASEYWNLARHDVVAFCQLFCWTYDPREEPANLPFDLFPRQVEYLRFLEENFRAQKDCLAEKCRDVGFTWLGVVFAVHKWLFTPGFKGTIGSRKSELVDKLGDPDSIFEKIRFTIEHLPSVAVIHQTYSDNHLKILNSDIGSSLTGEGGDNMGRGGRSSLYLVDEAAFVERPLKVDAAISANSRFKIYTSTPNGVGNPFATKRRSGKYPVFTFNWYDDPRKSPEWLKEQEELLDPVVFAQEVLIDYEASVPGIVIPHKWVMSAVGLVLPESGERVAGLDVADEGSNKNVLICRHGNVVKTVEEWKGENTTQTAYKAVDSALSLGTSHIGFDAIGVGAGVGATFKEMNPRQKEWTYTAIRTGDSPTKRVWAGERRNSSEKFGNLRAELAWILRTKFLKTHEHVTGIREHPLDELISIPKNNTLISQLSMPTYFFKDNGKLMIESKKDMAKRNIESPDAYDALALCFAPRTLQQSVTGARWSH